VSRNLTATALAELAKPGVKLAWLAKLIFITETLYVWTGMSDLLYDGNVYTPVGGNGMVSPITESDETRGDGIQLQLSGIPSAQLALVLGQVSQGLEARVWLAFLDEDGTLLDVIDAYQGKMDQPVISDDAETSSVAIRVENRYSDSRTKARRWNHEDQQQLFPGDLGFEFVADIAKGGQQIIAGVNWWDRFKTTSAT